MNMMNRVPMMEQPVAIESASSAWKTEVMVPITRVDLLITNQIKFHAGEK